MHRYLSGKAKADPPIGVLSGAAESLGVSKMWLAFGAEPVRMTDTRVRVGDRWMVPVCHNREEPGKCAAMGCIGSVCADPFENQITAFDLD